MILSLVQLFVQIICCINLGVMAKGRDFVMEMVETKDCLPYKDTIKGVYITNGFHYKNDKTTGDIAMHIFEETTDDISVMVNLLKCKSRENPDTCENYLSFPIKNYCNMVDNPKGMWKSYIHSFQPPLHCPFQPGYYNSTQVEFDNKSLNFFMGGGVHWKLVGTLKEASGRVIMCIVLLARRG